MLVVDCEGVQLSSLVAQLWGSYLMLQLLRNHYIPLRSSCKISFLVSLLAFIHQLPIREVLPVVALDIWWIGLHSPTLIHYRFAGKEHIISFRSSHFEIFGYISISYEDLFSGIVYIWFWAILKGNMYVNSTTKYLNVLEVLPNFGPSFFWDNNCFI